MELKITDVLKDVGTSLLQDPVQNHRKDNTLVYDLSLWWQQKHMISEMVSWQETCSALVCTRRRRHHSPDGGYLDQFISDLGKEVHWLMHTVELRTSGNSLDIMETALL